MSSYRRQLRKQKRLHKGIILPAIFILILASLHLIAPVFFSEPLTSVTRPIWGVQRVISSYVIEGVAVFRSKSKLAIENKLLQKNTELLALRNIELELLGKENARLEELLNRRSSEASVVGKVLVRPPVSLYDTFVIDVGVEAGISEGDLVLAEDVVIGSIVRVQEKASLAQLFSAPGVVITVVVGPENIPAESVGKGSGNLSARLSRDVKIQEGYFVVIPSLTTKIFAVVQELRVSPTDPFQELLFRIPINISTLDFVEIISGANYIFNERESEE